MIITLNQLTTAFANGKGVFDVTLSVPAGEVFGFLGPNGAGKTTTIRHLLGFLQPQQGNCTIMGMDCWKEAANIQKHLGYLPGEMVFFEHDKAMEHLNRQCALRNLQDHTFRDQLIDRFHLDTSGRIKKMSKGMKQKLGIITAFMHRPDVYILDEPTSGLDPLMQAEFLKLVNEEQQRGCTFFLSSHLFEEVEKACDRVGIIKGGKIVAIEEVAHLKAVSRQTFIVHVSDQKDVSRLCQCGLPNALIAPLTVEVTVQNEYQQLFATLSQCHVQSFTPGKKGLEETFIQYYQEAARHE